MKKFDSQIMELLSIFGNLFESTRTVSILNSSKSWKYGSINNNQKNKKTQIIKKKE